VVAHSVTFDIGRPQKCQRPAVFIRLIGDFILGIVNWLEPGVAAAVAAAAVSCGGEWTAEAPLPG
jgi:hypothetical protein